LAAGWPFARQTASECGYHENSQHRDTRRAKEYNFLIVVVLVLVIERLKTEEEDENENEKKSGRTEYHDYQNDII
jgi:hypothetical protein